MTVDAGRQSGMAASDRRPGGAQKTLAWLYARVSPLLAARPGSALATHAHAWVFRRTGGRVASTLFGSPLLVLRTVGRRSGRTRESPVIYLDHGDGYAVVASNAASARPPAWLLNVRAHADCEAFVRRRWHALHARAATQAEAEELWPRLDRAYVGFEHYRRVASRELPIVVLEPR